MLVPSLLPVYFLFVGLSLHVLAFLLYRHDLHGPEVRFAAVVTGVLGVVSLVAALLGWMESILRRRRRLRPPHVRMRKAQKVIQEWSSEPARVRDYDAALTATPLARCGSSRPCSTVPHSTDRSRPARRHAWGSWC